MKRDPRHHVLPGQPLRLAAEQINALNKMMRVNAGAAGGPVGVPEQAKNIILCRNDSGSAVARWGILEISGVVFDPSSGSAAEATFTSTPCVIGVTPTDSAKPFVIAVEPIADGAIGRVAVSGVVQCKLDVTAEGDKTAAPSAGSTAGLKTGSGPAQVLWKNGGTGTGKWGLVRIGGGGDPVRLCKTTAEWDKNTTATLDVWESGTPPSETKSTDQTLEAINKTKKVAADVFVIVARGATGKWYLVEAAPTVCDNGSQKAGDLSPSASESSNDSQISPGGGMQVLANVNGCAKWIQLTEVTYVTSVTLGSGGLYVEKAKAWVFESTSTATPVTISTTECPTGGSP